MDPTFGSDVQAATLDDLVMDVAYDNFFVDTPKQAWLRNIGAVDPFTGGILMREPTIYGRPMGGANAPGSTVTIPSRQILANLAFTPRLYSTYQGLETFSLEAVNHGPAKRIDLLDLYAQIHVKAINTDIEVDSFKHGQSPLAGYIQDDGSQRVNGDDEAMNNGIDPGWYGNIYPTYGGVQRGGVTGITLSSTPYFYGNPDGSVGAVTVEGMTAQFMPLSKYGGGSQLAITSTEGMGYIFAMFQRQQRFVDWKVDETIPDFKGIGFMGAMIYGDALAPGRAWQSSIPAGVTSSVGNQTDTAGTRTDGNGPYSFVSPAVTTALSGIPASTQISVGEPLFVYSGESIKYRPTDVPEFFFGVRRNQVYNSNSIDTFIMNLALNIYQVMPRQSRLGYGFAS